MTPEPYEPQIDLLVHVTDKLYGGDWRTAMLNLSGASDMANRPQLVQVTTCLRHVTSSLRLQSVWGDVEAASDHVNVALQTLRRYPDAHLVQEPPRRLRVAHLMWTTSRLVQRERADLDALFAIFEDLPRGQREVVYAYIEYLTTIEFDPFTVRVHPFDRDLTGLDKQAYAQWRMGTPHDICERATRLRQFADVWSGTVSEKNWQRLGGYPGVREQALRVLAGEPVTRGRVDLPIRLGRIRAWIYARVWVEDIAA